MTHPFVGRDEELRALGARLAGARRTGAPGAALVLGEAGSGKSRLLREVLAGADARRAVLLTGFEPIEPIPLGAVGDLVRRLGTAPIHGPRLEALVFRSVGEQGTTALPIFEAAHRALGAFGHLVVAVDDLQWVDAQSIALLHYILRAAESTRQPLALLAFSRPSANAEALLKTIDGTLPEDRRTAINLRGLEVRDAVALIRAIDGQIDGSHAEDIWRRAAGSPFWLEALARGRGAVNARDLVGERLQTLSADSGRLMSALAIVARPAALDELAALLEWPGSRLDHAVREVVARGLATEVSSAVRLAHDLIREATSGTIPTTTRRSMHARWAAIIEASAGEDLGLLAEALDHRAAAGLPTAGLATRLVKAPRAD
jgi:hypothetical protein